MMGDESVEAIRLLWLSGQWKKLSAIELPEIDGRAISPEFIESALYKSQGCFQTGKFDHGKELLLQLLGLGVPKKRILESLVSGGENSLAKVHRLLGQRDEFQEKLTDSISLNQSVDDLNQALQIRMSFEYSELPVPNVKLNQPLKEHENEHAAPKHVLEEKADGIQLPEITHSEDFDRVISDIPVNNPDGSGGFVVKRKNDFVVCAYFNANRKLTVACKEASSGEWSYIELEERIAWDSHNHVAMELDEHGCIHLCANMHNSNLKYFKSAEPQDISTITRIEKMVGSLEDKVTYPRFFRLPSGALFFGYRHGKSGDGKYVLNSFSASSGTWERLSDKAILDGEGVRNPYVEGPICGPDGSFHLCWLWRDTPDASTCHTLSYARSDDLVNWFSGSGQKLKLPLTTSSAVVIESILPGSGLINNNARLGFDAQKRPMVSYHKFDEAGHTQAYISRFESGSWRTIQVSDWRYRWSFGGRGSIPFHINLEAPYSFGSGYIVQEFKHKIYGNGSIVVEEQSLMPVAELDFSLIFPAARHIFDDISAHERVNFGFSSEDVTRREDFDMLVWKSGDENRDKEVFVSEPMGSPLKLISVRKGALKKVYASENRINASESKLGSEGGLLEFLQECAGQIINLREVLNAENIRFQELEAAYVKLLRHKKDHGIS